MHPSAINPLFIYRSIIHLSIINPWSPSINPSFFPSINNPSSINHQSIKLSFIFKSISLLPSFPRTHSPSLPTLTPRKFHSSPPSPFSLPPFFLYLTLHSSPSLSPSSRNPSIAFPTLCEFNIYVDRILMEILPKRQTAMSACSICKWAPVDHQMLVRWSNNQTVVTWTDLKGG